jgi:AraC-like DNA-binding protein/tetratricopeptide (TPR) repeat protein
MTELPTNDQVFIRKLTDIILTNLSNENFGVKELVHESGMSLYSLSRRLYSIKKKRINQFIREVRLEKAMEMLQNRSLTSSEIAYRTGFGSPAYFNKCFHEYFGYTPGEIKKVRADNHDDGLRSIEPEKVKKSKSRRWSYLLSLKGILVLSLILGTVGFITYLRIDDSRLTSNLISSDGRISIAVMPFRNMTNDTVWDTWQDLIQQNLISSLSNNRELKVRQKESVNSLIRSGGLAGYASISPDIADKISKKLLADLFVFGTIERAGTSLRVDAQLINSKTKEVLKSFDIENPSWIENAIEIIDTLSQKLTDYLLISKMIKENRSLQHEFTPPRSAEALRYYMYGAKARAKTDFQGAIDWCKKALEVDSDFIQASFLLENSYAYNGDTEQSLKWLIKNYGKRYRMAYYDQLYASWAYALSFESPGQYILYLKQLEESDDQDPHNHYLLGMMYNYIKEYDKAIPELEKNLEICRRWGKDFMKNNSAYTELGLAYHMTGQYRKERKIYKESEKNIPDDGPTTYREALLALAEKDTVSANRYIEKFRHLLVFKYSSPEWYIVKREADLYSEADSSDKADELYRKSVKLDPENPDLLNTFAGFLVKNEGDINEFTAVIDKALSLARNQCDYYKYLDSQGWGLFNLGRETEALSILQKTCDEAPFKLYTYKSHLEQVRNAVAAQK